MPALKSRHLIIIVVILLTVVIAAPVPRRSIGIQVLHDFGHAPIFGIVAIIALLWLRERCSSSSTVAHYARAFAISGALGLAVEVVQIPLGRDASWLDVRSDVLGAFGFLALFAAIDPRIHQRGLRVLVLVLGALALALHSWPLVHSALRYAERNAAFPVLFDARVKYEDYFLDYFETTGDHEELPAVFAKQPGEKSLRLHLGHRWSPYLAIEETVADWRRYRALVLDLTNASSLPLSIKVGVRNRSDASEVNHSFVRAFMLLPAQRQMLRIEIEEIARDVDVSRIDSVVLFDRYTQDERDVYVSRVWLE